MYVAPGLSVTLRLTNVPKQLGLGTPVKFSGAPGAPGSIKLTGPVKAPEEQPLEFVKIIFEYDPEDKPVIVMIPDLKIIEIIARDPKMDTRSVINEKSQDADLTILGFREEAVKHNGQEVFAGYSNIGNILFVNAVEQKDIK